MLDIDTPSFEGRISRLEEIIQLTKQERRDMWKSINHLRDSLARIDGTSALTLHKIDELLDKFGRFEARARSLERDHAAASGAAKVVIGFATLIGSVVGGIVQFILTHLWIANHS